MSSWEGDAVNYATRKYFPQTLLKKTSRCYFKMEDMKHMLIMHKMQGYGVCPIDTPSDIITRGVPTVQRTAILLQPSWWRDKLHHYIFNLVLSSSPVVGCKWKITHHVFQANRHFSGNCSMDSVARPSVFSGPFPLNRNPWRKSHANHPSFIMHSAYRIVVLL